MLATADIVTAVAEAIERLRLPLVVVDPVMVAKSGDRLLDADAETAYRQRLLPLATVVTPNLPETEALIGRPVRTLAEMREAARALHAMGPRAVVVKGGHLEGDAVDVFFDGDRLEELPAPRIATANTHGTGCTYSAAIAARLALGDPAARGRARRQGLPHGSDPPVVFRRPRPRAGGPPAPAHRRLSATVASTLPTGR